MNAQTKADLAIVETPDALPSVRTDMTPLGILDRALARGATPEQLTALMDLQDRFEKREAKKAFDNALAEAKPQFGKVLKNRHVGFESKDKSKPRTDYDHEDFQAVADAVDGPLGANGLSYRFRVTSAVGQPITVACILSHRAGHSEETTLTGPRDETGNKNALQQIGSTITYLQRYSLKAALGLGARKKDTDAADVGKNEAEYITVEQAAEITSLIATSGADQTMFLDYFDIGEVSMLPAGEYQQAKTLLGMRAKKGAAK